MNHFAAFNIRFSDAVALLPPNDAEAKAKFVAALIALLSMHVDSDAAVRCVNRALDEALGFNQPTLQLVKR
jgi:hypothetical protein